MVSIRFSEYPEPTEFVRDSAGITVTDGRVKWDLVSDDLVSYAEYTFSTSLGIKATLKWVRDKGYTSSLSLGGGKEVELRKDFTRQHIDLAKAATVDLVYEFFLDNAEEVNKGAYEELTSNDY